MVLAWLIIAFLYMPLLQVLQAGLFADGHVSLAAAQRLIGSSRVVQSLINTLWVTALTLVTVNLIGLFEVVALEFLRLRGASLLRLAYMTPLVFGSVAAVSGYNFVYSGHGFVTQLLRMVWPGLDPGWFTGGWAVLFVHSFTMTGYHMLFVRAALRRIDFSVVEAARSLGQSPMQALISVVLPLLRPSLLATSLMVLLTSLASFAAPSILGGREFGMLSQMIQVLAGLGRIDMAALLSLSLGAVSLLAFLVMQRLDRAGGLLVTGRTPMRPQPITLRPVWLNVVAHVVAYMLALATVLPLLVTIAFSFAPAESILVDILPRRFTLENYVAVLSGGRAFAPLLHSLVMACGAVAVALGISLFAILVLRRHRGVAADVLEFSLFLPWIVPSLLLAIGLVATYSTPQLLLFGAALVGSPLLLPIGYTILILPTMMRLLGAALRALDPNLDDAARALGATGWQRFTRVTAPLLRPVILLTGGLCFSELLSEYTLSVFLYTIDSKPLGVALRDAASNPEPAAYAAALVNIVLLAVFSLVVISSADRAGLRADTARS